MMMDDYDYDDLCYWDDVEYGNDEYWDGNIDAQGGQSRKQNRTKSEVHTHKRRKISVKDTEGDNVRFKSMSGRLRQWKAPKPVSAERTSFALLPDWRARLADASGTSDDKEMPEDMLKAATAGPEDDATTGKTLRITGPLGNGDEDGGDENAEDMMSELASLDPQVLKAILKEKLGAAGLEGMHESAFLQTISEMLSGGSGADDTVAELANSLLGQAADGHDTALSGWLSQQGVSLDAEERADDDDGDSMNQTTPGPTHGSDSCEAQDRGKDDALTSPQDSVVGLTNGVDHTTLDETSQQPSRNMGTKKRPAPEGFSNSANKRKKAGSVARGSTSLYKSSEQQKPTNAHEELAGEGGASTPDHDTPTAEASTVTAQEDEEIKMTTVKPARRRFDDATASSKSRSKPAAQPGASRPNTITSSSAPTARKRKVETDADDCDSTGRSTKKHASKAIKAAADTVEAGAKATRSTRSTRAAAKSGK